MRRMALCAASMLLLGCLAGCSTTPQNSQEQGNPVIKEEISQPLGGSEALGNSEDSSALSAADKEKMFAPYEQYGMTYDAVKDELTYNGNLVRWFEDYYPISNNETAGIDFLNENGTVDVYAVRDLESFSKAADGSVDPAGKLIGLKEFTQQEFDARDIEALKNSTSVAMAGTPLEDSETAKLVAEYEAFGVTYDAEKDQWYFNGEEVRYFRDVLTSNGESLTSGKFRGEMRTLGSGVGTIDIYTVRDYGHLNSEHHGTLTGIEKYSQLKYINIRKEQLFSHRKQLLFSFAPKIKKGATGNVDFLTFGHRDTDALRFENMDIAEELLSLTDGSACEQMRLSGRRSMGALFRCPHVVLM